MDSIDNKSIPVSYIRKEYHISKQLKEWFEKHNIDCWLNEGENKFTIAGESIRKPDMIIYSKQLREYIVIELKRGDTKKDLHDATKILDYWKNYEDKKTTYYIEDNQIKIETFCVATINSMNGTLYDNEQFKHCSQDNNDQWSKICIQLQLEPLWEGDFSRNYLRSLWANWRRIREKNQSGIGLILANNLNDLMKPEKIISNPLVFRQKWKILKSGKTQWKVEQRTL